MTRVVSSSPDPKGFDSINVNENDRNQLVEENLSPVEHDDKLTIVKLTKRRWAILFALLVIGLDSVSSGSEDSILRTFCELLGLSLKEYLYILQAIRWFPLFTIIPTSWFLERYGLKKSVYFALVFLLIKNLTKALLFNRDLPYWKDFKLVYWIISTIAGSQFMVAYLCLPLKVSEAWFPVSERSFAWTTIFSSFSIGSALMSFVLPRLVKSVDDVKPLFYFNLIFGSIAALSVVLCITKSKPKYPPSERAVASRSFQVPFFTSIKNLFRTKDLMTHLIHDAVVTSIFITTMHILQDILVSSGHTEIFAGNLMATKSIVSLLATFVASGLVHRFVDKVFTCKSTSFISMVLFIANLMVLLDRVEGYIVFAVALLYSISSSVNSPIHNDMKAQLASKVVAEGTLSGISIFIASMISTAINIPFTMLIKKEGDRSNYKEAFLFLIIVYILNTLIYIIFFKLRPVSDQNVQDNPDEGRTPRIGD